MCFSLASKFFWGEGRGMGMQTSTIFLFHKPHKATRSFIHLLTTRCVWENIEQALFGDTLEN